MLQHRVGGAALYRDHNDAYFRQSLIGCSPARAMSVGREGQEMCLPCIEGFFVLRCSAETATLWDDGSFGQRSARETSSRKLTTLFTA